MEEWVGALWHRAITRAADRGHAEAAVTLAEVQPLLGVLFRAAGGDAAMRLAPAGLTRVAAAAGARSWLQRIAGSGTRAALPWWAPEVLALPPELAVFSDRGLNRDLYVWLAAQAACYAPSGHWIADNRAATAAALQVFPGLAERHQRLLAAHLAQRPPPASSVAEAAVQAALRGQAVDAPEVHAADVAPVWLWFDGQATPEALAAANAADGDAAPRADTLQDATRRRARQAPQAQDRAPFMLPFRAEALFGWSELVKVNRATDDDENPDALTAAADLDHLSLARDGQTSASRVKFDLDLPSAAADDLPLGEGQPLPEWDFKRGVLRPAHCTAQMLIARPGEPFVPTPALRATAQRVRRRIEGLRAAPQWVRGQAEGEAIDLDAWVRHAGSGSAAQREAAPPVYAQRQRHARSLATLLLADLSLSTDAYVPGVDAQGRAQRVVDVVRDALYVFGEALSATGDAFEMLGFSSVRRQHVRIQHLKGFDEAWGAAARDRVGAIQPGYYTRMGAAIRLATQRLQARPERQRLLLLLTDGKPNDLDVYEGRYGLEDTRHAVQAAQAAGLTPFAVTIDAEAHDYLPRLFGQRGWALVRRPADLVGRLAQLHAQLVR
ncbi:VWA domain-containing protein [Ideonella sp. DXS22W]|uniref:VWA domain-containing protein n=1 Tax=Pseudaquabacterium inlustre TaxID=2984192 RepID=A0ABU9CBJ1_9BURK